MRLPLLIAVVLFSGCMTGAQRADRAVQDERAHLALTDPASVDAVAEYGWICEYGTVGMAPDQRVATLHLVKRRRLDLLKDALAGPSAEGRAYAVDALLYLEREGVRLEEADQAAIDETRLSEEEVRTCGNMGSYKIYLVPLREALSDSALINLEAQYEQLLRLGYGT